MKIPDTDEVKFDNIANSFNICYNSTNQNSLANDKLIEFHKPCFASMCDYDTLY